MPGARIKKEVRSRDLQGELVLLNLRTGVYFGLDAVGSRIWQLIEDRRSSRDIVEAKSARPTSGSSSAPSGTTSWWTRTMASAA